MTASAPPAPQPFPAPPDFPINWPDPAMAMASWQQDRQHVPAPMTPISEWLASHFAAGFTAGFKTYKLPLQTATTRLNTYFYMAIGPSIPPEFMHAAEKEAEPLLMAGVGSFWGRWESEWLPELKRHWEEWATFDQAAATGEQLCAFVDRATAVYERMWQIHFELLIPAFVGISNFQDLYTDLFPDKSALDAYRLLQGFDNMSMEVGRKLWALSRQARADPEVRQVIENTPSSDVAALLERSAAGRAFLAELKEFLAVYGMRSDTVQELADPSWVENPAPVFDNLRAYIKQDEDPGAIQVQLAEERERLVAEARTAIAQYPEAVRGQFEALLAAGQGCSRVQEDHNFWIDQRSLHEVRQLCLEFGRRLVARGELERADDVFHLNMSQAQELLLGRISGGKAIAARSREEIARWSQVMPAPFAGTDYGPPPDNPVTRAIGRFFGGPPPAATASNEIAGNAGSPGTVTGVARVIMSIADGGRLQPGEILVTPTTSPPWTPLFATAAGIVTDTGGVLSHCAIVAREYGIPAVVGAPGATSLINDGAKIEVNGSTGLVHILS